MVGNIFIKKRTTMVPWIAINHTPLYDLGYVLEKYEIKGIIKDKRRHSRKVRGREGVGRKIGFLFSFFFSL